ncbi:MAG: MBL fold metallo-hydrolase [Bryobacterales bacterium]|nr:MBL fold metallo-hydrolase [Bryobacterales bacterium]
MQGPIKITVLGSGTSVGIPTIGCHCEVCGSTDPRNSRLRPSILVSTGNMNVLIDTTPDLRQQALRFGIDKVDAILLTHPHADHIMGLDDIRPFNFKKSEPIPIFGSVETIAAIRRSFAYIFDGGETESSRPRLVAHEFNGEPIPIGDARFEPIRLTHGEGVTHGFRFANAAYLTDHSDIPLESLEKLHRLDVLFLDALRHKPHPTHSTVEQSLKWVAELEPRRAFFTHISHDLEHVRTESLLPAHVRLAYDGLEITTGGEG